jgi:hypothetical protein
MTNTLIHRKAGDKLSKKEKGQVFEIIVGCLLRNCKPSEIRFACREFNLSDRSISTYTKKAYEMIAERPMEAVERARRIEYSRIEQKQTECEHQRDWTELEKLKLRLLGLDDITVNHNHKKVDASDDQLLEIVSEQ